jgi:oligopeptide/dipeptide ABC transporter ATP-binding protein
MSDYLLKVHNLKKIFPVKASAFSTKKLMLKAVDGIDLDLRKGETLGLVGESGCGKTTVGRSIIRLYEPDGGRVFIDPTDEVTDKVLEMDREAEELTRKASGLRARDDGRSAKKEAKKLERQAAEIKKSADKIASEVDLLSMDRELLHQNRKRIQMVFQDPWASLNPRMLVKEIVAEGPREYHTHTGKSMDNLVFEILNKVGMPSAAANRYPHEFSGGQRQRIGIARALALNPSLIVCDEPVSALDVSIQAQVLNLLISLQEDLDLTYIFIAHDLSVVQYISDRVAVMYLGRIVESADSEELYAHPRHPYTISLLSAVPVADPDYESREIILEGDVPSPINPPSGCTFHPRCRYKTERCERETPRFIEHSPGHRFACFNPPEQGETGNP